MQTARSIEAYRPGWPVTRSDAGGTLREGRPLDPGPISPACSASTWRPGSFSNTTASIPPASLQGTGDDEWRVSKPKEAGANR